jgi:hypothetical protein
MRWLWIAVGVLAVYMLVNEPASLAHLVHQATGWLQHAAQSASTFVSSL